VPRESRASPDLDPAPERATCETCDVNPVGSKKDRRPALLALGVAGALATAVLALGTSSPPATGQGNSPAPSSSPHRGEGATLFDDFDGTAVDGTKWEYNDEWGCCGLSSESDLMDGAGVSVANGVMTLTAERGSTPSGRAWRSAVISTKGHFSQRYGVFQARMKWTKGNGLWAAFWLLQADADGRRPEIDILEAYPDTKKPGAVAEYNAVNHYRDSGGTMRNESLTIKPGMDLSLDWHTYELEWRPTFMVIRFDGSEVGRFTSNIPSVPMFIVLDLVVGSHTSGSDDSTPSPASLSVDWVKVTD